MDTLFEVQNITKQFGMETNRVEALKQSSFMIKNNDIISISGPSGAGKSTLLHVLSGLEKVSSGEILFKNRKYSELSHDKMAEIRLHEFGFVFQNFCLISSMSVQDNIYLPSIIKSGQVDEELFYELIKELGLEHRLNHMPDQLSGGEKQRVTIARALITSPSVIFADEPTGNLDSKNSEAVFTLLFNLVKKFHQTLIYVTHDVEKAKLAPRKIIVKDGVLYE